MKKQILIGTVAILVFLIFSLLSVSGLTIESVNFSPKEISPGEITRIQMFLKNNLNEDITDISISLDFNGIPFAPSGSSNEETIDELEESKTKIINFETLVLNNAESGIYKIPVKIVYYDDEEIKKEKESLISITVNSAPELGIEIEEGIFLKGQNNEITLRIINKGLSNVKFLETEIKGSTKYSILSQREIYLGDIDSDDFETAEVRIFFKENSPNSVNLPIILTYKDITNKKYVEEFDVDLTVYSREKALEMGLIEKSNTRQIVFGIIAVIVIWVVYRKIKKRRMRKKAEATK